MSKRKSKSIPFTVKHALADCIITGYCADCSHTQREVARRMLAELQRTYGPGYWTWGRRYKHTVRIIYNLGSEVFKK